MKTCALTPVCYSVQPGKWPYRLTADLVVNLAGGYVGNHLFIDKGKSIARLDGDILTIFAGYASDGASPYFGSLCGLRIGTPSPYSSAAGFFTHDCLYQFGELPCAPWSYDEADDVLYWLLRATGFKLAGAYHAAVALFGGMHRQLTRKPSTTIACISNHRRP